MAAGKTTAPPIVMRNDMLKFLYCSTLLELPMEEVRRFWAQALMSRLPRVRDEVSLFNALWQEGGGIDLDIVIDVFNALEKFLHEKGIPPADFIEKTASQVNRGAIVPAKTALLWLKPYMSKLFSGIDLRGFLLETMVAYTENLAPGIVHDCVRRKNGDSWCTATMLFMLSAPPQSFRLRRRTFQWPLPAYNSEIWTASIVQQIPGVIDQEPFEERVMLADSRQVYQVMPRAQVSESGKTVYIDGKARAENVDFHAFCGKAGLKLDKYKIPESVVTVMREDYAEPAAGGGALHNGCAYGAPVALYTMRYRPARTLSTDFLSPIIDEATGETTESSRRLEKLHAALVDSMTFTASFIYNRAHDTLSVNGKHLVKFVPARMVRKILKSYLEENRSVFEYRDFIRDPDIIPEAGAPNVAVRIQRLESLFAERLPQISLEHSTRGEVVFAPRCKIAYSEEE